MENSSYHPPSLETLETANSSVSSYSFNDIKSARPDESFLRQFSCGGKLFTCSLVLQELPVLLVMLQYN